MTKESKYNHTLYGEVGKATFYGASLVKIEGDPADTCGNEGDLYFKIEPTELEYLDFNTPVYALSNDGGKNYDITRKYRLYQLAQNWLHFYGLPVTDANTAKIAKLALENCWGTSIHDFLGDGQDDELFDMLEDKYTEVHYSHDPKDFENQRAIIKALKLEADTRYANQISHWFKQTIEQQTDLELYDALEMPFKVLGFIQDVVKLIEKDPVKFSNWFNQKDLATIKKHIDQGTNMMILSHFVIEEASYWISQNYTIDKASIEHFFEDLDEWIQQA